MEIELHPTVSLLTETFNVLVAPVEMLVEALNRHLNLQRYKILYVCGNSSRILSRLDRNFTELEVRRAFTSFQLMTILQENRHTFLIVEHDPMLYEDAGEMVEYVAQALKQTSREATILLYAPALDPHIEKMTDLADRVFCFYEMPKSPAKAKGRAKANPKMQGAQATLEAYS
jgi:DNA polymerase I